MLQSIQSITASVERLWHCAWSPDGLLLATCGADKTIRLYKKTNEETWILHTCLDDVQSRTIRSCEFSPTGLYLASGSFDGTTVIWAREGQDSFSVLTTLEGHENEVKSVAWNSNGSLLATCGRDKTVWIWQVPESLAAPIFNPEEEQPILEWECVSVLSGHLGDVKMVKFHPVENILISCSYDDNIRVWEEEEDDWSCQAVLAGHSNTVWNLTFIDSDTFATCAQDLSIRIWKRPFGVKKWEQHSIVPGAPHSRCIYGLDSQQKFLVSCGGDDAICVYGVENNNVPCLITKMQGAHEQDVNCVKWNPFSLNIFASVGDDGVIRIWRFRI